MDRISAALRLLGLTEAASPYTHCHSQRPASSKDLCSWIEGQNLSLGQLPVIINRLYIHGILSLLGLIG